MKGIGGYFELELKNSGTYYHDTPHIMKSGRSALHYILEFVKPKLVYIPFYSCKVLLEPFDATGISYKFYTIDKDLNPAADIELEQDEYFLYINYLDLKRETVARLSEKYKDKLIVDATQAFFMKGNTVSWFFNSCRKFFGVPDGAYIYPPATVQMPIINTRNDAYIFDHLLMRFNGHTQEGYGFFLKNEIMAGQGIKAMSKLSEYLLSEINYKEISEKRRINYDFLHARLKDRNLFNAALCGGSVPLFYPFVIDDQIRPEMINHKIYVSILWSDIDRSLPPGAYEDYLASHLLPLPVDHRYNTSDMKRIVEIILNLVK